MKKWKRCIAVIGILWCVGCTKEETQVSPPEETMTSYFELNQIFGTEDGCYYIDENSFLQYADFHKKKTALVCSRANCRHEKWTDDTPDEERCQAYIPGLNATGFVAQEKLYLFEPNMEEAFQSRLICSNLDRSNQKEVAVLEGDYIYSFAVKNNKVYAAVNVGQFQKTETGSMIQSSQNKCRLYEIDLKTGDVKQLIDDKENYGNNFVILGAEENRLYLLYSYTDQEFTGNNFDEIDIQEEYYCYDIKERTLSSISLTESDQEIIQKAGIEDGSFISVTMPKQAVREDDTTTYMIKKRKLSEEEFEIIEKDLSEFWYFGENLIYKKGDSYFQYDVKTDERKELPDIEMEGMYLIGEWGDWYYVNDENGNCCFMEREDFLKGKKTVIE